MRLLDRIGFDMKRDRLWLCGDLVNRGPDSLGVLRWARDTSDSLVAVLGNHDLHLLARAEGIRAAGKLDTMDDVLEAPDRGELLDWLAGRPLAHTEEIPSAAKDQTFRRWLLVHAGLWPQWSPDDAVVLAREATNAMRADRRSFLRAIYESPPAPCWSEGLTGSERLRAIVAALVRLRTLDEKGELDDDFTGPPTEAPPGHRPWFEARARDKLDNATVLCGHWAALGLVVRDDIVALDTGCVWGGKLTALRLEDLRVFQVTARP